MLQIDHAHVGQRIDNYLLRILRGVPRSRIYRILRKGEVRVNGARIKPDYRVQAGDTLRLPPLRMAAQSAPSRPPDRVLDQLTSAIVHEDAEVLVINKPSGLAVHKGSGLDYGVIEALRFLRPQQAFLELVHRLDRDTSGCLLVAKTPQALKYLHTALRTGTVEKRYLLLVAGQWQHGHKTVDLPLSKNVLQSGERMVVVSEQGRQAQTRFQPLTVRRRVSWLEAQLATGRTHQIRVHAAALGHPIAGDTKYGDRAFNHWLKTQGLQRLFLHAHSLSLDWEGRELAVSAPLEAGLQAVLDRVCVE
jgi:23S rRNA pseudouridine955/2504/2580 synthase